MTNAEYELDRHGSNGQSEMPRELYEKYIRQHYGKELDVH